MTYGLDQCRVCGRDIPLSDPRAIERHAKFSREKPTMTEKQWRRAGFLAAPTRYQLQKPMDGLCFECKYVRGTKRYGPRMIVTVFVIIAVSILLMAYIGLRTLL
jgi:hypothetical protein